jgi:membrane protease YdiL (CAAX protease family)
LSPASTFLALVLYPLASFSVPLVVFLLWPEKLPPKLTLPVGPAMDEEKTAWTRLDVILPMVFYCALLLCVTLWTQFSSLNLSQLGFRTGGWASAILRGGYVGLSWAGVWLWTWFVLSAPQRLHRVVPGLAAPFVLQTVVWVVGAFSEEIWRVVGITALLHDRYSPIFSVITSSLVFAVAFLPDGLERSALAWLEGVIFGVLFLWERSFLAPFAAHLAVQAVYLWGVGQLSSEQRPGKSRWTRVIRCPVCGVQLRRLQVKISEDFECPSCHKRLSTSEEYRTAMRWAAALSYMLLFVCSLALLYDQIEEQDGGIAIWLVCPIAWGAGTSLLFLYQRVFPPSLQYGETHFLTLNLDEKRPSKSDDTDDTAR